MRDLISSVLVVSSVTVATVEETGCRVLWRLYTVHSSPLLVFPLRSRSCHSRGQKDYFFVSLIPFLIPLLGLNVSLHDFFF